jgi:hypothetical protein
VRYPIDEDPRDEGRLADLTCAGMWTTAGIVGAAMLVVPGSPREHVGAVSRSPPGRWPGRGLAAALPAELDDRAGRRAEPRDLLDLRRPAPVRPEAAQWSLIAVTFRPTIGETGGFA